MCSANQGQDKTSLIDLIIYQYILNGITGIDMLFNMSVIIALIQYLVDF